MNYSVYRILLLLWRCHEAGIWLPKGDRSDHPLSLVYNSVTKGSGCFHIELVTHSDKGGHRVERENHKTLQVKKLYWNLGKTLQGSIFIFETSGLTGLLWTGLLPSHKLNGWIASNAAQKGFGKHHLYSLCTEQTFFISSIIHNLLQCFQKSLKLTRHGMEQGQEVCLHHVTCYHTVSELNDSSWLVVAVISSLLTSAFCSDLWYTRYYWPAKVMSLSSRKPSLKITFCIKTFGRSSSDLLSVFWTLGLPQLPF